MHWCGRVKCRAHNSGLCAALLFALAGTGAAQQFSFRHYGFVEGLQNLTVLSLAQDGAGYIWAGTEGGLYRYDGTRFRLMTAARLKQARGGRHDDTGLLATRP